MRSKPKYIKYSYKNRERLWVKVDKIVGNNVYGKIANTPIEKGLKFGDLVKIRLSQVLDSIY